MKLLNIYLSGEDKYINLLNDLPDQYKNDFIIFSIAIIVVMIFMSLLFIWYLNFIKRKSKSLAEKHHNFLKSKFDNFKQEPKKTESEKGEHTNEESNC